jgi:branched-chain amino acid aminotransferase
MIPGVVAVGGGREPAYSSAMPVKVWINGTLCDERAAMVSVFDRGFLYGDSVYEVMRTAGGRPVDLERHLDRLGRSAAGLQLPPPVADALRRALAETLAAAANAESYIRIIETRGAGEIGLDIGLAVDPTTIVIVRPLRLPAAELYERGARLEIVGVQRTSARAVDPSVKSGNYLNNVLALAAARRAGADEALMCDASGRIAEGSTSNVFAVVQGGIVTPPLEVGLLPGITRQRVIELTRAAGIEVAERTLLPGEVRSADELFITSSVRGLLPATRIDGRVIGDGLPGPVTRRAMGLYAGFLAEVARGEHG